MKTRYNDISPFTTLDGSDIRELMHPKTHGAKNQSLAEAVIHAGEKTRRHLHRVTEEIYHVTEGEGVMTLGDTRFPVSVGDSVLIPPGTPHCIAAATGARMKVLCCCSPAYSHEDTELLE